MGACWFSLRPRSSDAAAHAAAKPAVVLLYGHTTFLLGDPAQVEEGL